MDPEDKENEEEDEMREGDFFPREMPPREEIDKAYKANHGHPPKQQREGNKDGKRKGC